jgi:predicted transposase YdaD
MLNLHKHPIKTIFDKKTYERKDKYGSTKKFTSYKCQWKLLDNQKYTTWIPTNNLFPYNNNNISEHNLIILTQYFQSKQQKRHQNIINK